MGLRQKYLTKSKFKVGHECPSKLYFMQRPEYPSTKQSDSFLEALAEGGFQVGELAKIYHPGGHNVATLDKGRALAETAELMRQDRVTIFEAAVTFGSLFVRVDVLEKIGDSIRLTEVKSKTFDDERVRECGFFTKKKDRIDSEWEPYLIDVAFQSFVLAKAFPTLKVTSNLMLVDKERVASIDGLNQRFFILPDGVDGQNVRVADGTTKETVGTELLRKINVDDEVRFLWGRTYENGLNFERYVESLTANFEAGNFVASGLTRHCKDCEYRIPSEMKTDGKQSGFEHCFSASAGLSPEDCERPFVFDIRNNWRVADKVFPDGKMFADELTAEDINPKSRDDEPGWSESERKMLQIEFIQNPDLKLRVLSGDLRREMDSWTYPYHFIDFETARVAIPFNRGRRPYEQIAFQFSHHMVTADGRITHEDQYLNVDRGVFPNFDFVRNLKRSLEKDRGTIFRYHNHENTVLNEIRGQIDASRAELQDADELIAFIDSITIRKSGTKVAHVGPRNMVDLCQIVDRFYFHRDMGGRTSIKKVFPAVLNDSTFLQEKYSKSNLELGITSLARREYVLIRKDASGKIVDPYADLPPVFEDMDIPTDPDEDGIVVDGVLKEGGAAMTAYARMQFSEMHDEQRRKVEDALLRYCELDTLAMVLIWEYWANTDFR